MDNGNVKDGISFYKLEWDTEYFGVTCAKAILYKSLNNSEWNDLKTKFKDYQFISIENRNSEPVNAQFIGRDTSAYLADVNIQFLKRLEGTPETPQNITVHQGLSRSEQVINLADFQFSKFTEDPELAKRGGGKVYHHWLMNSFENSKKFYALSKDQHDILNGFLLHSYSENACVIELIAVSRTIANSGIGTSLFGAVELAAYQKGLKEIKVGTQVRNMGAINFYNKVGCKMVGCHQVYHLWRTNEYSKKHL